MIFASPHTIRRPLRALRKAYDPARAGSLWVPKVDRIRCWGTGTAGGFASRNAGSAPRDTPLNIDGNANLQCWLDPSARLTLGTTLLALTTGTPAPSVCTISADTPGTLTTSINLVITVAATGTRGTATFNYSIDGGLTNYNSTPIATGADVALPGIGLRVQFATGTYTAGVHSYQGLIEQIVEGTANAHTFVSPAAATSRCFVKSGAKNGKATITSDANGGNKNLKCTTSLAATLGAGSRTIVGVFKTNVTAPVSTFAWLALNSSTDPDPYWKLAVNSVGAANDIGVFSVADNGVAATTRHGQALDLAYHLLSVVWDAGTNTITVYDNGVQIFTGSQAVGTQTFDTVFLLSDVGPHALNGEVGEVCMYNAALSTATRQTVEGYFRAVWGFP